MDAEQTNQERVLLTVLATEKPSGEIDFRIASSRLVMQLDLGGSRAALNALVRLEKETARVDSPIEFFGDQVLASAVRQAIARCHEGGNMRTARELEDEFGKYLKIQR